MHLRSKKTDLELEHDRKVFRSNNTVAFPLRNNLFSSPFCWGFHLLWGINAVTENSSMEIQIGKIHGLVQMTCAHNVHGQFFFQECDLAGASSIKEGDGQKASYNVTEWPRGQDGRTTQKRLHDTNATPHGLQHILPQPTARIRVVSSPDTNGEGAIHRASKPRHNRRGKLPETNSNSGKA